MRSLKTALLCALLTGCATIQHNQCVQEIATAVPLDLATYYCDHGGQRQQDRLTRSQRHCLDNIASLARTTSVPYEILATLILDCIG